MGPVAKAASAVTRSAAREQTREEARVFFRSGAGVRRRPVKLETKLRMRLIGNYQSCEADDAGMRAHPMRSSSSSQRIPNPLAWISVEA